MDTDVDTFGPKLIHGIIFKISRIYLSHERNPSHTKPTILYCSHDFIFKITISTMALALPGSRKCDELKFFFVSVKENVKSIGEK